MNIEPLKLPKDEASIMKHWKYTDKVYISCVCITFNQENYIKDAINGMLAQITDYRFEILIHDDSSTDNTIKLLNEYKKKYPTIINLILQEENQYKLGKKIIPMALSYANSKYLTICEGDDYWIDNKKLQKQIIVLENNKTVNIAISKAISLYKDGNFAYFCDQGENEKLIPFSKCISGPNKDFFPTATFFFKKNIMDCLPEWFYTDTPVSDYYIQLFASYPVGCIYLPDITAVYRREAVGSWTSSTNLSDYILVLKKRIICNELIGQTFKLNKIQKTSLKNRKVLYFKDLSFTYLKCNDIKNFIKFSYFALNTSPLYYFKLIISVLKSRIKK